MNTNFHQENINVGMERLKPVYWNPIFLGDELYLLVSEGLWSQLLANEYIWQTAQIEGKEFAELVIDGFYSFGKERKQENARSYKCRN
ncbi:hypothetical protein [Vibrio sp. THAF190c]|jgi:hypothetical protein|uniref:hypothetical protein n=1 Tax=Vibrio sp. THAF190c TaxID=2587865 RepID=UPI001267F86E|nr:hypothetical protein [Vibrio sp. THAF190c]QFT13291.1 hypothetical protein FIV04_25410 [Vibrio sp. THAF190c]